MPVTIHGKEYKTVAERVTEILAAHVPGEISIRTRLIHHDDERVVCMATIHLNGAVMATGHAEEVRASSQINRTSALENCETSAVGRALAFAGYGGTEIASADEVAQAIHQQSAGLASVLQAEEGDPQTFICTKGKYKGEKSIGWICEHDQKYVGWFCRTWPEEDPNVIAVRRIVGDKWMEVINEWGVRK